MLLRNKSIDELLDREQELQLAKEDERDGTFFQLIRVYEELYKRISRNRDTEYATSLRKIKKQLIAYLIQYGTYLKTVYQKDDKAAEKSLEKAVKYEPNLPIAYYRLGFLKYKEENYASALFHFKKAIQFQERGEESKYRMTDQQVYNCHLFLANCGLFIAKDANESVEKLAFHVNPGAVPDYQLSPLYDVIQANNRHLEANAYRMISREEEQPCSREECEAVIDRKNTIILDFTNRENLLIFNGREKPLTKDQAEMIRYFLLYTNEETPANKHVFYDLFSKANDSGEIPRNTYVQKIRRLREKLTRVGIDFVIENRTGLEETAYFYNNLYPYVIMHRSDESFLLSE